MFRNDFDTFLAPDPLVRGNLLRLVCLYRQTDRYFAQMELTRTIRPVGQLYKQAPITRREAPAMPTSSPKDKDWRKRPRKPRTMLLADLIREHRERRGWTQSELGRAIGVESGAISKIERGLTLQPNFRYLWRLGDTLNIPYNQLFWASVGENLPEQYLGPAEVQAAAVRLAEKLARKSAENRDRLVTFIDSLLDLAEDDPEQIKALEEEKAAIEMKKLEM